MKNALIIIALFILSLVFLGIYFLRYDINHVITSTEITYSSIGETIYRIDIYMKKNNAIPESLSILPKRDGYMNRITDGWGRPLTYSISEDGVIKLTSFGKDGKLGGFADDSDITKSYKTRDDHDELIISDPMWINNAEIQKE